MPTDWQPILGRFVAVDGIGRPIQLAAVDTETRCGQTFGWTDLFAKIGILFFGGVMFIFRTWSHTDLCYVPEVPSFNNSLVDGVGDEIIVHKLIYSNIYFYPMS